MCCESMLLAQVMGLYLFLVSLASLLHQQRCKKVTMDLVSHPTMLCLTGCVALILGLLIVLTHNIWVSDWRVLVTLIGWIVLLQGVVRIYFPEFFAKTTKDMMLKNGYLVWCWVWLVIGIYLIWAGFSQ